MPLEIVRNDITKMTVDAIVNAANPSLLGGGGVDGAIHRAAGPELLKECETLGGCRPGQAKITKGYRLRAKYVIHTVGPVWHGGAYGEKEILASCYENALRLALAYKVETIAFPLISAGAYGYPKDQALSVAMSAVCSFLMEHEMTVYLVIFGRSELDVSKKLFRDVQEYIDDVYVDTSVNWELENTRKRLWQRAPQLAQKMDADMNLEQAFISSRKDRADAIVFNSGDLEDTMNFKPLTNLDALLQQTDEGFSQMLLRKIDEKGMTDAQCYKKANVDRKLFSKIRSNPGYKPSKPTAFAFAAALELPLEEARELLGKAGFSISHSSKFDIIVEYCFKQRIYNVMEINEVLFHYDLPLLGSGVQA